MASVTRRSAQMEDGRVRYGRQGRDGVLYPDSRGEGCFTVRRVSGMEETATLPGVLAGILAAGRLRWGGDKAKVTKDQAIEDLPRIPLIEKRFFVCFLVQLIGIAHEEELAEWARGNPQGRMPRQPVDEESWREALLRMAPMEAWRAIGAGGEAEGSAASMALLQPPYQLEKTKVDATEPSELDWLMRGKAHEVKAGDGRRRLEDWIYVLTSKATSDGFLGVGGYGSVRMKGGAQCRIYGAVEHVGTMGEVVAQQAEMLRLHLADLHSAAVGGPALIDHKGRDTLRKELLSVEGEWRPEERLTGVKLTWTLPWEAKKTASIPVDRLHPCFIEASRTLQLIETEAGDIACLKRSAKSMRLSAESYEQAVRTDPWHFVIDGEAMGMGSNGFAADFAVRALLDDRVETGPLMGWPVGPGRQAVCVDVGGGSPEDREGRERTIDGVKVASGMRLHLEALARGQGKIEGYFSTVLDIPEIIAEGMKEMSDRERLFEKAEEVGAFIGRDGTVKGLIDRAVRLVMSGGKGREVDNARVKEYTRHAARELESIHRHGVLGAVERLGYDGTVCYRPPEQGEEGGGNEAAERKVVAQGNDIAAAGGGDEGVIGGVTGGEGTGLLPSIRRDDLLFDMKSKAAKVTRRALKEAAEGGLLAADEMVRGRGAAELYVSRLSEDVFGVGPLPF